MPGTSTRWQLTNMSEASPSIETMMSQTSSRALWIASVEKRRASSPPHSTPRIADGMITMPAHTPEPTYNACSSASRQIRSPRLASKQQSEPPPLCRAFTRSERVNIRDMTETRSGPPNNTHSK